MVNLETHRKYFLSNKDFKYMDIKIYSTTWCGPCKNAKSLLNQRGIKYQDIDIEKENMSREDLFNLVGGRTVPQIIIDGNRIGGFEDLVEYDKLGKLNPTN